jgi:hypothetical protein
MMVILDVVITHLLNIWHVFMMPSDMFLQNTLVIRDVGAVWTLLLRGFPTFQPQMSG